MTIEIKPINIDRIIANKYIHLLTMLLIFLTVSPFVEHGEKVVGVQLVTIFLMAIIILCLRATIERKGLFWFCVTIAAGALFLSVVESRIEHPGAKQWLFMSNLAMNSFFVAMTIVVLMKNMFRTRRVTADIIVGGICVYLLIGIFWSLCFWIMHKYDPEAIVFVGGDSFLYFSFTTLTTLGYGDMVPMEEFAKVLTSIEAVSGQMYLAIFVARLVGLHIATEMRPAA